MKISPASAGLCPIARTLAPKTRRLRTLSKGKHLEREGPDLQGFARISQMDLLDSVTRKDERNFGLNSE